MKGYLKYVFLFILCVFLINTTLSIYKEDSQDIIEINVVNPEYIIVFNKNDDRATGSMENQRITYGSSTGLSSNQFVISETRFLGWATSPDGDVVYDDGENVLNLSGINNQEIELYAKWDTVNYEVSFDKNGEDATGSMDNQSFVYNVSQELSPNLYRRPGYKFMGWATDSDGDVVYTDSQSITIDSNITLYAVWMRVMSGNIGHVNDDAGCTDSQCMIDKIYDILY